MDAIEELETSVEQYNGRRGFRVTGIAVQYAVVCERELWLYLHGVEVNKDNSDIVRGTKVDNTSYTESAETQVISNMIAPDILEDGRVIEVKPSSVLEEASKRQLQYYLWFLEKFKDWSPNGVLAYPTERRRKEITLDDNTREIVENTIQRIYEIKQMESPPSLEKKKYCTSCAYQDICWLNTGEKE